ncbi:MAG: FAD-binding oxidoreductase [Verrucomicrobia bacterium]|nr:FAD-binding oxidoreductase [Verrucomicrobiota bacterium]
MSKLKDAKIVIIGGGAVGCGTAYQLALAGETDILVIEKEPSVAAVTSAQAAGLVGQVRTTIERTQLAMWSVKTFSDLQKDTKTNPTWRQVGSLRVALNAARVAEFKRMKAIADRAGLEAEFITPKVAEEKWPGMNFSMAKAILWCPTDGYLQPYDLTASYCSQSGRRGVRFSVNTAAEQILMHEGRVTGVVTNKGTIRCDVVINAAGAHAFHIAKLVGLQLPIVPVRHEYFVSVPCDGLTPTLPVIRVPDLSLYIRTDVNALLVGGWEPNPLHTDPQKYALNGNPPGIEPDWDVLAKFAQDLVPQFPKVADLGIRSVFKGWPTFTPDGRFIIGPTAKIKGFVMAGGCNAHGVSGSAGIGRHVVESLLESQPSPYVQSLGPDRFTETSWNWDQAQTQAAHVYETYYGL